VTAASQYMGIAIRRTRQVPKSLQFLVTGGLGYLLGAALLFVFVERLGVGTQPAYVFQVIITFGFVWVLNRYITWHDHTGSVAGTLPGFVACRLVSIGLAWGIYTLTVGHDARLTLFGGQDLTINYQIANALGVAAATVCNYAGCKYVVFADSGNRLAALGDMIKSRRFLASIAVTLVSLTVAISLLTVPFALLLALWALNALLMVAIAVLNVSRMLYAWQSPERATEVDLDHPLAPKLRFSLIVPARREPILQRTLLNLLTSDYPRCCYEVLVVVADDDPDTELLAREIEDQYDNVQVVIDASPKKSKPQALEAARPLCTGDLVGVVDAESILAPGLLSFVNTAALQHPGVGIFQGGVQLMNHRAAGWARPEGAGPVRSLGNWFNAGTSWWRARNCFEYYVWFMSRLRFQASSGFVPLGGNTVFVRRDVLERLDGWDVNCLTEDCDLGVRAAARGVETVVFHHPELATREETPDTLGGLVVQRTRWMSGFIQVFRKKEWSVLPRRQRLLAFEALTMPLFQAYAGVAAVISLVLAFVLNAPVALVVWTWVPFIVTAISIVFENVLFRDFGRRFDLPHSPLDSLRFIIASPFYQLVLSAAAVRAVVRLALGKTGWEKTTHSGQHLDDVILAPELADVGALQAVAP
jgi:cellulose synthase/poly-beta-1,6-N-acetylglucosamine synthase-like glycosyltransferase